MLKNYLSSESSRFKQSSHPEFWRNGHPRNGHSLPTDNQNHESTTIEKLLNIKPEIFNTLKGEIT